MMVSWVTKSSCLWWRIEWCEDSKNPRILVFSNSSMQCGSVPNYKRPPSVILSDSVTFHSLPRDHQYLWPYSNPIIFCVLKNKMFLIGVFYVLLLNGNFQLYIDEVMILSRTIYICPLSKIPSSWIDFAMLKIVFVSQIINNMWRTFNVQFRPSAV